MMTNLKKILQPYSIDRFLSENWTKQGIVIPGECPDKFQHLFSWQHLNDLLNFHSLREPQLRFVLDGKTLPSCDPKDWVKQCKQGASLVVSRVEDRVPAIADLNWALEEEIGHSKTHANVYCSWPSQQGFKSHYDSHEVFIMQVDGQKEWFVFEDTVKHPYRDEPSKHHKPPEGKPYIHCMLKPGDLLYIPRGHWHYAIAREEPSLHITLGIRCFTGRDALEWLCTTLQNTLQQEEVWRQSLPLMPHGNTYEYEAQVKHLFDSLVTLMEREKDNLTRNCARAQYLNVNRAPEISLPNQVRTSLFEQELDTILRRPKFQRVKIERVNDNDYLLITPQKQLKFKDLPPTVVDTLVKNVLSQEAFTIRDVIDWLPECELETHILPLLAGLVKEGILIEDSPQQKVESEKTGMSQGKPKLQQNTNSNYAVSKK